MTKPSPWGGEPAELAPCPFCGDRLHLKVCHDSHHGLGGTQRYHEARVDCPACQVSGPERGVAETPNIDGWWEARLQAIAAWNRRTPSRSPDGYEVQWRPRSSDTWDGGSAGVYRTAEIVAEVVKEFAANGHETRVRPIAYLDGSQSPYPPDRGRTHWEGCWRERGHHNCAVAEIERLCIALGERES